VTDSEGFRAVYEYDAAGNRTRWWANDDLTTPRPRDGFEVTYTYDAADQLLQALRVGAQPNDRQAFVYAYDANGNRVNLNWPGPPGPDTQGMDYAYDREGRLITAQAYQTNHRGQRVDREVTRLFYDGLGRRLVKEYDPKDGGGGVKRTEYVFDNLDPVAEYFIWNGQREEFYRGGVEAFSPTPMLLAMRHFPAGAEGQTYWVHLDGRGSVAGITKHQGQSTHNYRYDAYGQVLPAQGNWTDPHNHYTFAGKEWDEHLGLYEFGVRLYDPWAGVWLTREPLPGDAWEPRTWHRYQYAFANPISYYDPYGMQTCGFNILTGERECFGERTGMGWTPTLAWTPLPPEEPMPAGASSCPVSPADLYTLGYGGYRAWQAGQMLRGGLRFVPGTTYPGQIVVYGTQEARQVAGISPYLTHARWTHPSLVGYLSPGAAFSRELLSKSTGVGIAFAVGWDVYEYGWGSRREAGLGSAEFAAAVTVDVGATALIPALGAAAGGLICGPGAPACVVAGAALGNFLVVWFSASGLREQSIEAISGFYETILQPSPPAPESWEEIWSDWPNILAP